MTNDINKETPKREAIRIVCDAIDGRIWNLDDDVKTRRDKAVIKQLMKLSNHFRSKIGLPIAYPEAESDIALKRYYKREEELPFVVSSTMQDKLDKKIEENKQKQRTINEILKRLI